jgi:cyclic 2,3-diphosphoglycerate synthase
VTARAIAALMADGEQPVAALLAGGIEKLGQVPLSIGIPVVTPEAGTGAAAVEVALAELIERTGVRRVIDLSDEPVLGYRARTRLASVALWRGATYAGPDFVFTPPDRSLRPPAPSVAVIGTSKRVGKTAIAATAARGHRTAGLDPVVVAMGRGGPAMPERLSEGERVDPARVLEFVDAGRHGASDYIEDALISGAATVGAWRAGGGLAGAMAYTNLPEAVEIAAAFNPGLVLLESSGAAVPPAHFDVGVLVASAGMDLEWLSGYFGLYRLLLADLVVLTKCEDTMDRAAVAAIERCARSRPLSEPRVVRTVFRPHPLADVTGKKIWFGTTADERVGPVLKRHLEATYGCEVIAMSHALANRDQLRRDLEAATTSGRSGRPDTLVVELKAAVEVVTRWGREHELDVVFVDNRLQTVGGDATLETLLLESAEAAKDRFHSCSQGRNGALNE